jgi:hypothetical protein
MIVDVCCCCCCWCSSSKQKHDKYINLYILCCAFSFSFFPFLQIEEEPWDDAKPRQNNTHIVFC